MVHHVFLPLLYFCFVLLSVGPLKPLSFTLILPVVIVLFFLVATILFSLTCSFESLIHVKAIYDDVGTLSSLAEPRLYTVYVVNGKLFSFVTHCFYPSCLVCLLLEGSLTCR